MADEAARVDAGDRGHAARFEPVEPAALRVGRVLAVVGVAHDHRARLDAVGLHRRRADAVVADQRIGEGDDLARVAGIGDRLLVAGHRRVEDDLAQRVGRGTAQVAFEARPVLEQDVALAALAVHLTIACTCLNAGSVCRAEQLEQGHLDARHLGPARSIRARPMSRSASVREPTASAATWTSVPCVDQVERGLSDADVRLDAADERLVAIAEVEALDVGGGEAHLLERLRAGGQIVGDLGNRGAEPPRILLGDDDRNADRGGAPDQRRAARAATSSKPVERLAKGLLDVDHDQRRAIGVELHAQPPIN